MLTALIAVLMCACTATESAAGQLSATGSGAPSSSEVTPTSWGDPDLQGIWQSTAMAVVPFERPREFGNRMMLTEEEYAKTNRETANSSRTTPITNRLTSIFYDPSTEPPSRRSSMIVDPPDGRFPRLTADAAARDSAREAAAKLRGNRVDTWEEVGLWSRCITRTLPGAWMPRAYNNYRHILQTPGYVMIYYEEIHDARIIPLDGRPHVGDAIRGWMGDSRGRWEGKTLVIETTNFRDTINFPGSGGGGLEDDLFVGDDARLTERLTRVDANTINLDLTVHAPTRYTSPFTVSLVLKPDNTHDQIIEYACHEGSSHVQLMLSGSRAEEKAEAEAASPQRQAPRKN